MTENNVDVFKRGMRDGVPIGLGYLAVAFSLGIIARNVGLNAAQGFFASLFTIASAGEYAGFTLIGECAPFIEMVPVIFVANCRYILMSCALSQKMRPGEKMIHRIGVGSIITDEIFGANIAYEGYLNPLYTYGVALVSIIPWALGTMFGVIMGNVLPASVVSALSVALYGMFIAIIIPPAKKSRVIAGMIIISFILSFAFNRISIFEGISSGVKTVILTVLISAAAALLFPVEEEAEDE